MTLQYIRTQALYALIGCAVLFIITSAAGAGNLPAVVGSIGGLALLVWIFTLVADAATNPKKEH